MGKALFSVLFALIAILLAPAKAKSVEAGALVVLDIGHSEKSGGAVSPDKKIREFSFWYRNVAAVKAEIEKSGYHVIVCNRGEVPKQTGLAALAASIPVVHLNDPDTGKRYPSRYHPDRIGAGMVCADYGIEQRPACMVFLHLNSIGNSWRSTSDSGLVLYNKLNGLKLAQSVCASLNAEVFREDECKGRKCRALMRTEKALGGAGWLNTLDDEGIPAVVFEALYLDNRQHVDYLSNPQNTLKLARAVAHGIITWLKTKGE